MSQSEIPASQQDDLLLQKFRKVLDVLKNRILEKTKFKLFGDCYPAPYQADKTLLRTLYTQFIEQIKAGMEEDIEEFLKDNKIEDKLKELYKLNLTQSDVQQWRPSGNPTEDIKAHLIVEKRKEKIALEEIFTVLQQRRKEKMQLVKEERAATADRRENIMSKLDGAIDVTEQMQYLCSGDSGIFSSVDESTTDITNFN